MIVLKIVTGYDLAEEKQINYLEKLGFEINKQKSFFSITAPSWRHDIFDKNDIIEEIARLDGYDKIPFENLKENNFLSEENIPLSKNIEIDLREKLANLGLNEIKSFTFISPKKLFQNLISTIIFK